MGPTASACTRATVVVRLREPFVWHRRYIFVGVCAERRGRVGGVETATESQCSVYDGRRRDFLAVRGGWMGGNEAIHGISRKGKRRCWLRHEDMKTTRG